MKQATDRGQDAASHSDDDYENQIAALERAPTGEPLRGKDYVFLFVTGVVIPAIILIWGWV